MPSSITLTVSHLPTSTSFFLSALQPLNYAYRGRSGDTIGFGPTYPPNTPPDFWITQEIPGVPAGAAHVAFAANSRPAVQDFFVAALKAGAKIHGEPCVRDKNGYYSAAVIDFDGNSIEAVYRPGFNEEDKENDTRSVKSKTSMSQALTVASRSPSEAPSNVSNTRSIVPPAVPVAASQAMLSPRNGDALDALFTEARSAASVARELVNQVRPNLGATQSTPKSGSRQDNTTSDAVVGTLLGVAAGAALTYAFANRKNSDENRSRERRPSVSGRSATDPQHYNSSPQYRAIQGPPSSYSRPGSGGKYITMNDNDYESTVRPMDRRESIDSGFFSGPGSTVSKASHRGAKLTEAPPSSYRGPGVQTSPEMKAAKKSGSRSSSISRTPSRRSESHTRRMNDDSGKSAHTVVHITEKVRRVSSHPPPSTNSKSVQAAVNRQEDHPLPPSRASTWGGAVSEAKSRKGGATATKSASRKSSAAKERDRDSDMTKSVIGKVKDVQKLDLPKGELTPSDSVSQVSSVKPSSRRSRRG